jgi:RNA polymerase sigma factor (sigma-70 family)
MSEDDVFDLIAELTSASYEIDADETVSTLLATLSTEDQQVVRLAILHGLNGETLANELGVSRGAARVRLHRALGRLRQAYTLQRDESNDNRI